eukprot:scaffold279730_cov24-Tisochrysis_lutea.AAC.1
METGSYVMVGFLTFILKQPYHARLPISSLGGPKDVSQCDVFDQPVFHRMFPTIPSVLEILKRGRCLSLRGNHGLSRRVERATEKTEGLGSAAIGNGHWRLEGVEVEKNLEDARHATICSLLFRTFARHRPHPPFSPLPAEVS